MNCSTPGFPVLHHLPELAQTHVHWVDVAIQLSHPLFPFPLTLSLSQHQGLFQWVNSWHQVARVLENFNVKLCSKKQNTNCHVTQSVQFSRSVVSDSLWPHGLQHARLPFPSPTQTHVHWVSDANKPSHPLSFTSSPAFNLSQHQGLFQWVSSSNQVAKVLEFQL